MATNPVPPSWFVGSLDCDQGAVRAVRFNVDGNYLLTCGSDKSLKLWNPERKLLLRSYNAHGYEVLDARGSCDNSQLVSCSMDKTVIVWDVSQGSALRKYRGHAGTVNCVRFNEDSSLAISGSIDGTVKCWDVKSKRMEPIQTLDEAKDSVTTLDVTDHEILAGSADGKLRRYDIRNGQMHVDLVGAPVSSACFTRDGQCLLISSSNGESVKLFDKSSGELLQEFKGHANKEYRVESVLNNTDQLVISGSENGYVYIWDLVEGSLLGKVDHERASKEAGAPPPGSFYSGANKIVVHSLSHHPSKSGLATAVRGRVYLWSDTKPEDNEDSD